MRRGYSLLRRCVLASAQLGRMAGERVGFKEDIAHLFTFSNASNAGILIIVSN